MDDFAPLLTARDQGGSASGWNVRQIMGGANSLVYYAYNGDTEVAVKFSINDERDRAGREYDALTILQNTGLDLAPHPLLLERYRYRQPVVVQSWLAGEVSSAPPDTDEAWTKLLEHYAALARVRPEHTQINLKRTVLNASSFEAAKTLVREQLQRLPESAYLEGLQKVVPPLLAKTIPAWREPPVALCRGDSNLTNFVRRTGGWCSLDWEYGGWGDPAFEMADLITHPAYAEVLPERWPWVVAHYAELTRDARAPERIQAYVLAMSVWWTVLFCSLPLRRAAWPRPSPSGVSSELAS